MVHSDTYAMSPQIDFRIQMDLTANLCMYLWYADVSNAFAEAERPNQMYYKRRGAVFRDGWKRTHPDIHLPPDAVVPILKNLQGHPQGPRHWAFICHDILIALKFKAAAHSTMRVYYSFASSMTSPLIVP
jgi:hypothetical protein